MLSPEPSGSVSAVTLTTFPLKFTSSVGKPDLYSTILNGHKSHRGACHSLDLPGAHCSDFDSLGLGPDEIISSILTQWDEDGRGWAAL